MKKIFISINARPHRIANRKISSPLAVLTVAGCLTALLAFPVRADIIIVPNFSFEANANDKEGNLAPLIDDWDITGGGNYAVYSYNSTDSNFSGTTGGNIPSPGEGTDIHLSNLHRSNVAGSEFSVITSSNSLATVIDGFTYTLTVAGGNRLTHLTPDQYTIELLVGGVSAASNIFDGNTISADSFQDITTSFTATSGQAGNDLKIRLTHSTYAGTGSAAGHFDNVRLIAVPEPSSLVLVGLSWAIVYAFRRKSTRNV